MNKKYIVANCLDNLSQVVTVNNGIILVGNSLELCSFKLLCYIVLS